MVERDVDPGKDGAAKRCASSLDAHIPSFDDMWGIASENEGWRDEVEEEYQRICKERGIDPEEECSSSFDFRVIGRDEMDVLREKIRDEASDKISEEAVDSYNEIVDFLRMEGTFDEDGYITIYRSIVVPDAKKFIDDAKSGTTRRGLGVYWTSDFRTAYPYWKREKGEEIILSAKAGCNDIDFEGTIEAFMVYSRDCTIGETGESEIRVKKGVKIRLEAVYTGGSEGMGYTGFPYPLRT